jgi:RimJ/RimL family protein N-acetyltransferase
MEPRACPEPFESERLLLRAPREGDVPAVLGAIRESWASLHAWMEWAQRLPTPDEQLAHTREARRRFEAREDFPLYLFDKASGAFAGGSGLHRVDWSVPRFEIGYWVRERFRGRGYAVEAVGAIAERAFGALGARRLEIRMHAGNAASVRVAERAGFALEGVLRNERRHVDGSLGDTRVYALVR